MNTVDCDKCGTSFVLDDTCTGMLKRDNLVVQYVSCPTCGAKYPAFTSDTEMRKLIERRKAVQLKIKAAFAKKFREKTIWEYEKELDQIKRQQKKLMPGLKATGEKILRQAENTSGGTQNVDTTRDNTTGPN